MDLILSAEVTSTSSSCFHLGVLYPRQHSVNGEYRHSKLSLIITSTSVCCCTPPLPNTRVLLEQAFTSASTPALLDLRPLTSFKIRAHAQVSSRLSLLSRSGVEQRLSFCSKDLFQGKKWKWTETYFELIKLLKL